MKQLVLICAVPVTLWPSIGWAQPPSAKQEYQTQGVISGLPVFYSQMKGRMNFPLAWSHQQGVSFNQWKIAAREKVRESWLSELPSTNFDPQVLATDRRSGYSVQKVVLNISADSRVLGLMTIPDGTGPFPAVLLLHDHGAEFRIGKEKVIRSWGIEPDKLQLAEEWVGKCYGGRFVGDELARRGYVCLAVDALNWSDRGGGGYDNQQALAANLMQMGITYAGLISQEDLAAAEFLASWPRVDAERVAALGFSMGSCRCWHVAAMSDRIAAGICICSMASLPDLLEPGMNITRGQSAFTMLHPGISRWLDYPDVASIACPKPMLFYGGRTDKLTPEAAVIKSYHKMKAVWASQDVADRLETKLWEGGHEFTRQMQESAFEWLASQLE